MINELGKIHVDYVAESVSHLFSPLDGNFSRLLTNYFEMQEIRPENKDLSADSLMSLAITECARKGYAYKGFGKVNPKVYELASGVILANIFNLQRFDVQNILDQTYLSDETEPSKAIKIPDEQSLYQILYCAITGMEELSREIVYSRN